MKRNSNQYKNRQIGRHYVQRKEQRRITSRNKHKCKRIKQEHALSSDVDTHFIHKKKTKELIFPEVFDLHKNTNKTLKTLKNLRENATKKNINNCKISFLNTNSVGLSALLVATAEINVLHDKILENFIDGKIEHKYNPAIAYLLNDLGFFKLLGKTNLSNIVKNKNLSFLEYISSEKVEGELVESLKQQLSEMSKTKLQLSFYDSAIEAITNIKQHAYPEKSGKWWISGAYDNNLKKIYIAVYDRGITIAKSIKKSVKWRSFVEKFTLKNDADLICESMRLSVEYYITSGKTKSSSHELNRGKGLRQLLDFIEDKEGHVNIVSGRAFCQFSMKNSKLSIIKREILTVPLDGTLIEWEVTL